MDKDLIKNALFEAFVKHNSTQGTEKVQKDEDEVNKEYYDEVTKKMADYAKTDDNELEDGVKMNYEGSEKEYHDEMEIRNGQEMLKYDREPSETFKDRAKKSLTGDSTMGNAVKTGKWNPETGEGNGNTESVWGASNDNFGSELVATVKSSNDKRNKATVPTTQFGDDIEVLPKGTKTVGGGKKIAVEGASNEKDNVNETFHIGFEANKGDTIEMKNKNDDNTYLVTYVDSVNGMDRFKDKKGNWVTTDGMGSNWVFKKINNLKVMEGIKRLRFKSEFNGVSNALNLIPESYKVDNKIFEMTDGNETYRVKWEGSLTEGQGIVVSGTNKKLVSEEMSKMKHLIAYSSLNTLGAVKGKDRIDENNKLNELINKTKELSKNKK